MQSRHVLELPNDLGAIERSVQFLLDRCRDAGFEESKLRLNLRVGVAEALANAMMYGNRRDPAKRVRLEAWCGPDEVRIRVTDEGPGFNPGALPDPTLPDNRTMTCGRGVFLIRQLMDRVEFNETGNSVEMFLFRGQDRGQAKLAT
ncbi:MAG TPA: ATP-binding protein [Longimicrobiales bacterium]|nr:ATP-binding protein [Longimicrobiales bacterium]